MIIGIAIFFLSWAGSLASAKNCTSPSFYTSLPRDSEWFYGVARDPDTDKARDAAVRNLGKQVSGGIEGWDDRQIAEIAGPGYDRARVSEAIATVLSQTPLSGWEQDDYQRCDGYSYVLVRVQQGKAEKFLAENAKFRNELMSRLEGRVANVEARQAEDQAKLDSLEKKIGQLKKMLDERDAAFAERQSTLPTNIKSPLDFDREACDHGEGEACFSLGARYETGQGVDRDLSMAFVLYHEACDLGNGHACDDLGLFYAGGSAKSEIKALKLYQKACDLNEGSGCGHLGSEYYYVKYDPKTGSMMFTSKQDKAKALLFSRKACDLGNGKGCYILGSMYFNGEGVGEDKSEALSLYRKACDLGSESGCEQLGEIYEDGVGVSRDVTKAISFYHKACGMGDSEACHDLSQLGRTGHRTVQLDP